MKQKVNLLIFDHFAYFPNQPYHSTLTANLPGSLDTGPRSEKALSISIHTEVEANPRIILIRRVANMINLIGQRLFTVTFVIVFSMRFPLRSEVTVMSQQGPQSGLTP